MKQALRKKYKQLRAETSTETLEELSLNIANKSLELDRLWAATTFHLFLPIKRQNEVNTEYLLHILQGKDKQVVISKSDFNTLSMTSILLTDATKIEVNRFGIPEPVEGIEVSPTSLDVIFIPLLAFDKAGNRLGYGKGFYDIFLKQCPTSVLKVGLSLFPAEDAIPAETHDQPLDYCITPNKIYSF